MMKLSEYHKIVFQQWIWNLLKGRAMKLFRLYTENKNYDDIIVMVSDYFDGFTVIKTEGYWKSKPEHSLIIEIMTDNEAAIQDIAWHIRKHNKQESVLVVEIPIEHKFIQG